MTVEEIASQKANEKEHAHKDVQVRGVTAR